MFKPKTVVLAGVELSSEKHLPIEESLDELGRLADTAGFYVIDKIFQKKPKPDLKYFIGSGKIEELKALAASKKADLVIFDNDLSPSQNRNLEEFLGVEVIDRTALILRIFARHAKSREGKIQVELAEQQYKLPRLSGMWEHLSRQKGGIGLREVGETQIEIDRRLIKRRISWLKKEIEKIKKDRFLRREKRIKNKIPLVSIVGYTNAGKSTLLNLIAKTDSKAEDKLFATLDPTTRRVYLPSGKTILLSDTVGFIQKLPHLLVESFAATLEEAQEADLLLHVVDFSQPHFEDQIAAVYTVLEELKCINKPIITVFNKIDLLKKMPANISLKKHQPWVAISAKENTGVIDLVQLLSQSVSALSLTGQKYQVLNSARHHSWLLPG